jgi:carboxymethylenebutenolidase
MGRSHISRPATLPAPVVVVLQELFGVNADIRATCDELAVQGYTAIAERAKIYQDNGPRLSILEKRDHGSLLTDLGHETQRGPI